MNKIVRATASATVLLALFLVSTGAKTVSSSVSKASGGSTGDSMIVAADTSAIENIPKDAINWYVASAVDSLASIKVIVSPDGGTRWFAIDIDTTASGAAEATANFGGGVGTYAGWQIRIIMDNLTAAGAPFGRAYIFWNKGE